MFQIQQSGKTTECRFVKKLHDIVAFDSSFTHFMALQKRILPAVEDWTPQEVADFMSRIGFDEVQQVIIFNKIDGQKIKDFDEDLFVNTIGISGTTELQKIRFEIGESRKEKILS